MQCAWFFQSHDQKLHYPYMSEEHRVRSCNQSFFYRVYFTQRGTVLYLLLLGGDKSTQKRDIKRAIAMANALTED